MENFSDPLHSIEILLVFIFLSISARYLLLCTDKKRYINTFCLLFYSILARFFIDINCCIVSVTFCEKHFVNKV